MNKRKIKYLILSFGLAAALTASPVAAMAESDSDTESSQEDTGITGTLTFKLKGGNINGSTSGNKLTYSGSTSGGSYTLEDGVYAEPKRAGFTFAGWSTSESGSAAYSGSDALEEIEQMVPVLYTSNAGDYVAIPNGGLSEDFQWYYRGDGYAKSYYGQYPFKVVWEYISYDFSEFTAIYTRTNYKKTGVLTCSAGQINYYISSDTEECYSLPAGEYYCSYTVNGMQVDTAVIELTGVLSGSMMCDELVTFSQDLYAVWTNGTQKISVKKKSLKKTYSAKKLKKKKKSFKIKAGAKGKLTYKKVSGNKHIKVSKNGKVTVKKGTPKGTYKIKVRIKAAKTSTYKAASKTVTVKVKVKK